MDTRDYVLINQALASGMEKTAINLKGLWAAYKSLLRFKGARSAAQKAVKAVYRSPKKLVKVVKKKGPQSVLSKIYSSKKGKQRSKEALKEALKSVGAWGGTLYGAKKGVEMLAGQNE